MFAKLFIIFVICVLGNLLWRPCVVKLAWSTWKVSLTFFYLPSLIVLMIFAGMTALVLPVVGIVAIIVSIFK